MSSSLYFHHRRGLEKSWGHEVAIFRQTDRQLKFPTEEIVDVQNLNFAPKFYQNGGFSDSPVFGIFEENFPTSRKFADRLKSGSVAPTSAPSITTLMGISMWNLCCCCSFLDEVGTSCEAATEFLALYKKLFAKDHWKYYLAVKGVPVRIAALITKVSSKQW